MNWQFSLKLSLYFWRLDCLSCFIERLILCSCVFKILNVSCSHCVHSSSFGEFSAVISLNRFCFSLYIFVFLHLCLVFTPLILGLVGLLIPITLWSCSFIVCLYRYLYHFLYVSFILNILSSACCVLLVLFLLFHLNHWVFLLPVFILVGNNHSTENFKSTGPVFIHSNP